MSFSQKPQSDSSNLRTDNTSIINRDKALIKAACKGDANAFATLVSLYSNRVRAFGMSFFKNSEDTEDFVQDVFIKVYTKLKSFRGESLFSTWLMRLAYNHAVNSVNRRKNYASLSDKVELFDTDYTPEEQQIRSHTIEVIRSIVDEMPEKYSTCLDMYFFYDMPYNDIAEILDIPINTIKSHIFRAKKLLRDKLVENNLIDIES